MSAPRVSLGSLVALAWPIVLARATQAVIGFTDALMVAPLGENALTATTTGAINSLSLIILPMGTVFIVQSFVAQLVGQGRTEEVRRYAWYGLALAGAAALFAVAAIPIVPAALGLFPHDRAVEPMMVRYIQIRLLSVGGAVGVEALGNWYGGLGNTHMQMRAGVVTMVVNVAGCWLLIQGHAGAPALGTDGSAWAAVIASWSGFAYIAWAFHRQHRAAPAPVELSQRELLRVLRFGLPNGANWFFEFGAFALFLNLVVAELGKTTLAALNVIIQINSVAFMPAFGVATAGAILAGQTIGAAAHDRVWPIVRLTLVATIAWMLAVAVVDVAIPSRVMGWFAHDDPHTGVSARHLVTIGAPMLAISAAWQLFDAIAMTFAETLRAAGDTVWCLIARMVLAWGAFLPISLVVVYVLGGGATAIMLCLVGYLMALSAAMVYRFRRGRWRTISLTEREPALV